MNQELLFNRAVNLIMGEWGMDKDKVLKWLSDDVQWNQWEYGGEWRGNEWIENDEIVYYSPPECRND
jgi:hypothetical protein